MVVCTNRLFTNQSGSETANYVNERNTYLLKMSTFLQIIAAAKRLPAERLALV